MISLANIQVIILLLILLTLGHLGMHFFLDLQWGTVGAQEQQMCLL